MHWDFEKLVDRRGTGNMKYLTMPISMKKAGRITFSGAEMDFKTAPVIIEALTERAKSGLYGYTLADENYLAAIISWMKKQRDWHLEEEWIIPTDGTMKAISLAIRAFTKKGDGVIVQPPIYQRYFGAVEKNERQLVNNPLLCQNGEYKIDFAGLAKLMAEGDNRLLIFCNPHNPVGKVWNEEDLRHLAFLAKKYGVQVISDEIFGEITFNGHNTIPLSILLEEAIVCTSLGKTFNFTGFSHSNVIISSTEIRERFVKQRDLEHYGSLNPFIRDAVIAAYTEGEEWFLAMLDYVYGNFLLVEGFFQENRPEISLAPLEGTFTAWINWGPLGETEPDLHRLLIENACFAADQGNVYGIGGKGFSRINLATPRKNLQESLVKLAKFLGRL